MKKQLAVAGGVLLFIFQTAHAGMSLSDRFRNEPAGEKFVNREFSLDLFGIWASRDRDDFDDSTAGIGVGVNYYFIRLGGFDFGASAETYVDELDFPNHIDFSALVRFPIEKWSLSPYAFVGFGRQYHDECQWTGHIGGGVEYRLNSGTGIFLDVRGIFPDTSKDLSLWRLGLRLTF